MRKNRTICRRGLALLLSLVLCLGMIPGTAWAASNFNITYRVFNPDTGASAVIGHDNSVSIPSSGNIQVSFRVPWLSSLTSDNYGRVTNVTSNAYFSGLSEGISCDLSRNNPNVTFTYWVSGWPTTSGDGSTGSNEVVINNGNKYSMTCTVVYHSNYPSGQDFTQTYTYRVSAGYNITMYGVTVKSLTDVGFSVPSGYKYLGWTTTKDGSAASNYYNLQKNQTLHLYAKYSIDAEQATAVKLTYMNGESTYETQDHLSGDNVTVISCTASNPGYAFMGWAASAELAASGVVAYDLDDDTTCPSSFVISRDTTLYAVWKQLDTDKTLTNITKVRVTAESESGYPTDTGADLSPTVTVATGGSVTLLYKITVTGEVGARYTVSDVGAAWVSGPKLNEENTLDSTSADIYVTKTFTGVTADTQFTNTAVLRPGDDTKLPDDAQEKEVSSTPETPTIPQAALSVTKSVDKSAAEVGDELTYTITVTNSGSEDVTGVTVTDTLPDGVDFVRAGQRGSYVFDDRTVTWSNQTVPAKSGEENGKLELTLTVRAKAEGAIANTAHLTAPVTKDSNEVTTSVGPKSNRSIKVTKKMGNAVVNADAGTATVEYTVTVTNIGNVDLYGLRVDDTLTTTIKSSQAKMTIEPVSGYVGEETDSNVTVNGNTERRWTLIGRDDKFAIGDTKVLKYQLVLENIGDDNLSVDLENTAVGGAWSKQTSAPSGDPSQMPGRRAVRLSNDDPDITDEGSASGSNIGSSSGNVEIPAKCKHSHDEDGYCTEPDCKHIEEGKTCCEKRPDAPVDYELTYSSNGGVGTMGAQTASSTDSSHTFIVLANGFTREGWHFTGWNTEADGSGDAYGAGSEMTLQASAPTATLYAQWAENITPPVEYTYKLTCYDGTEKRDVQTVTTTAAEHTFVIPTVSRPGYELLGWSETDGGRVDYTAGERITLTSDDPEADLYAVWKELETDPEISDEEILALGIKVRVVCSANETHDETIRAEYALQEGTFEPLMSRDGKSCTLRIIPDAYIERFNNEYGTHSYDETSVQGFVELVYVEPELDIDVQSDEQDPAPVPDGEEMLPVQEPVEPNDELNDNLSGTPDSDVAGDTQISDDTDGSTELLANEGEDAENGKSSDPVEFFPMALEGEEETAGWQLADGERGIVTFSVYCEKQEPDEPETEEVTVTWLSGYGANAAIKTEVIVKGSDYSGLYPGAPTHDGYRFTGWSAPVTDPAAGNITITAQWEALPDESRTVTVTWQNWNGDLLARENWDQDDPEPSYPGRRPIRPDSSRYTYTFAGWDRAVDDDGNVTYTARFDRERIDDDDIGGGGGGGSTGGGTTTTPPATNIPDVDVPQGDTTNITDDQTPLAGAIGLNNTEHFAYMIGYDDGTVGPMNQITRAEVATIFFRLMDDSFRSQYWSTVSGFSDVTAGKWFNNAVSTATNAGKLTGYPDGTFRPNQSITRAEFAAIAVRFLSDEVQGVSGGNFSDTAGHWAADAIGRAAAAGWIAGYPDGTFRPNAPITRAEAATIINNMLGRTPDKEHLLDNMIVWPDNPESAWYYEAIQEATNSHDYERDELGITEIWSAIQTVRDWKALEEQWAA